ncbi:SLOG family protein [Streptomyces europaeiscabiei]|uniref:SLOG family protein n=1 Tax=Streptomyces europaeiscabiei TaxID=146819 RepID=UPI0029B648A5|nr:SLOG family protein [Streptomyces europaeiscabiei]MDX3637805.1 SLOG family protein [Streptomyces europaeiscabiei]MDX3655617.1 SLOG family protein [Streptomyces europaeiscabiei]
MTNPYRVLVTGSRDWQDRAAIDDFLTALAAANTFHNRTTVIVHGACPTGADAMADDWARWHATRSPLIEFERHRAEDFGPWPRCGPIRNAHMVSLGADACLAFIGPCTSPRCRRPDPHPSHGATGCADLAEKAGIPVRRFTA